MTAFEGLQIRLTVTIHKYVEKREPQHYRCRIDEFDEDERATDFYMKLTLGNWKIPIVDTNKICLGNIQRLFDYKKNGNEVLEAEARLHL
uniref:Uncharacterized protein n=1 Tax=Rhizophagus irregularis (strain DAOM 181602 / DAOM 197198 / MUCL 43194) TaxID=747089 RepID=U9T0X7_RHIID